MNRREFLKRTFQIAGVAGLYSLGAGAIEEAIATGIMPALAAGRKLAPVVPTSAGGTNLSWSTWDESTENGWGNPDVHICVYTGAAGANDFGQGLVTGAGLTHTQVGTVDAYSGAEAGRRIGIYGADVQHYFTLDSDLIHQLSGLTTYTFIVRINNLAAQAVTQGAYQIDGANDGFSIQYVGVGLWAGQVGVSGSWTAMTQIYGNPLPAGADYWFANWGTGTVHKCGIASAKPNSEAGFDIGIVSLLSEVRAFTAPNISQNIRFIGSRNAPGSLPGYIQYMVMAKYNLFA